jgi:hypothetical protein
MTADPTDCRQGGLRRAGSNLAGQIDDARVNALLVAIELRVDMATGDPGALARPAGLHEALHELLGERLTPTIGCPLDIEALGRVVLIAHSGGYQAAAAVLARGDLPQITEVVLFDALYGADDVFARWVMDDIDGFMRPSPRLRFVDLYTCCAGTAERSLELFQRLRRVNRQTRGGDSVGASTKESTPGLVFRRVPDAHDALPNRYAREIIEGAGFEPLPSR